MTAVLQAKGLDAGYGRTTVVRDLDLDVAPGEVVALIGPNGAGKTTTLMTLGGALTPLSGDVWLGGAVCTAPLHRRARAGVALVTEQRAVLMTLTVAQNLRVAGVGVERAVDLFPELCDHLKRRVGDLSGGQQQMLAMARALGQDPKVLLADELSLGLAPLVVDRLLEAVRAAADTGVGVVLVEQHVTKALQVADRVLLMQRGRVELDCPAAELAGRELEVQAGYLS